MGQALPDQHPAVVLRSHFNTLRALLAVARTTDGPDESKIAAAIGGH